MVSVNAKTTIPFIGNLGPKKRGQRIRRVCEALERTYGHPRLGNPQSPIDDLVYIVLSNRTLPATAKAVYANLKRYFPSWQKMLDVESDAIRKIIHPAGLSQVKTDQIKMALLQIRADFGRLTLEPLKAQSEKMAMEYLISLPGVSEKVAKCVQLYTMQHMVLPVDVHVHRISCRLGWTTRKRADQCHAELESLVPRQWRYVFHVGCVVHGRTCCRSRIPNCETCCIRRYCLYEQE